GLNRSRTGQHLSDPGERSKAALVRPSVSDERWRFISADSWDASEHRCRGAVDVDQTFDRRASNIGLDQCEFLRCHSGLNIEMDDTLHRDGRRKGIQNLLSAGGRIFFRKKQRELLPVRSTSIGNIYSGKPISTVGRLVGINRGVFEKTR